MVRLVESVSKNISLKSILKKIKWLGFVDIFLYIYIYT
jgi:hypothetical protein